MTIFKQKPPFSVPLTPIHKHVLRKRSSFELGSMETIKSAIPLSSADRFRGLYFTLRANACNIYRWSENRSRGISNKPPRCVHPKQTPSDTQCIQTVRRKQTIHKRIKMHCACAVSHRPPDAEIKYTPLVGAQGYQRFPHSKSVVGQNIALHAAPADADSACT